MSSTEAAIAFEAVERQLGSRGSREFTDDASKAADLTPVAAAVLSAVPAWWQAQARAAGLQGEWLDVEKAIDCAPPVALDPDLNLEDAWRPLNGYEVGAAYVEALSPGTRARHGRHYTPAPLAQQLWSMARLQLNTPADAPLAGLVRDPACGAGALLLPALRDHLAASSHVEPQVVLAGLPNLIEGIDLDPAAVWIANVVLAAEMLPTLARIPSHRRRPLPALARVGDGLEPHEHKAAATIMNPPYGRVRLDTAERSRFAPFLYGHANLYGLFLAAAFESVELGGVIAALVPTSFTSGRYFESLREQFASAMPLGAISFVSKRNGTFTNVLQETCLAVFSRSNTEGTRVTSVGDEVLPVAVVTAPTGSKPWILPRRESDSAAALATAGMPLTLASAGWRASTGPLVWNRRREDLHSHPAADRVRVVWAADIDGGTLHRDQRRSTHRYLRMRDDADRRFLVLEEPAILVQRTTAPEQRRRLIAAELTAESLASHGNAVVVENHVNVLRPTSAAPLISRETLLEVLATETIDQVIRSISGSVALSAYELESIPLPDASILAQWDALSGDELSRAVTDAYSTPPS